MGYGGTEAAEDEPGAAARAVRQEPETAVGATSPIKIRTIVAAEAGLMAAGVPRGQRPNPRKWECMTKTQRRDW